MSKKPTISPITMLALLSLLTASINANAGRIRQWTDPETGVTTFGDAPTDAAAKHIQVRPSEGFSMCGGHCQDQANAITIRERSAHFRKRDKACRRLARHYVGDSLGEALGKAAKEECALNKARAEIGLEAEDTGAQAQQAEHFEREGARRERASDRAAYRSEQAQNRNAANWRELDNQHEQQQTRKAIDRNTDAIERLRPPLSTYRDR